MTWCDEVLGLRAERLRSIADGGACASLGCNHAQSDLDKERDDNASALFDSQYELVNNDPLRALDLVTAIVSIEDNPNILGLFAAGMLQDLLPGGGRAGHRRRGRRSRTQTHFRDLLRGACFSGLNADVIERLDKARS